MTALFNIHDKKSAEPSASLSAATPNSTEKHHPHQRTRYNARFFLTLLLLGSAGWAILTLQQIDKIRDKLETRAENLTVEQKTLGLLADQLGYSGFLGAASRFADIGGQAQLDKMHESLDIAEQTLTSLTAASYGHSDNDALVEIRSIFELYQTDMNRAEQSFINHEHDPNAQQTLLILANALPELTQRLQALIASKNAADLGDMAHAERRLFWLLMTFLLGAILSAVYAHNRLERRYRNPIAALIGVVRLWRQDSLDIAPPGRDNNDYLGSLARELDLLRLHFQTLSDITLKPGNGQDPVRLKFDGQTRALFDILLRQMTEASSSLQTASDRAAAAQNQTIALAGEMKLSNQGLAATVEGMGALRGATGKTLGEIESLLDFLRIRVETFLERTNLTGQELTDALRSIVATERTWHEASQDGQVLIGKFAATADELSERLSTATNLLRAGGRALSETAENSKTHLNEIVGLLRKNNDALLDSLRGSAQKIDAILERTAIASSKNESATNLLDQAITGIRRGSEKLGDQLLAANNRFDQMYIRLDALEQVFGTTIGSLAQKSRQLVDLFETLQTLPVDLKETITASAGAIAAAADALVARGDTLEDISEKILSQSERLQAPDVTEILNRLMGLGVLAKDLSLLTTQLDRNMPQIADAIAKARSPEGISPEAIKRLNSALDTNIAATEVNSLKVASLLQNSRDHIGEMLQRLRHAQEQAITAAAAAAMSAVQSVARISATDPIDNSAQAKIASVSPSTDPIVAPRISNQPTTPNQASGNILARFKKQPQVKATPSKAGKAQLDVTRIKMAAEALSATASLMLAESPRDD